MQAFVMIENSVAKMINPDWNVMNVSACECECDKSCDVGEYLDFVNCKCRKRQADTLVQKCDENVDGNKMNYNDTLRDYGKVCRSCMR